MVPKTDSIAQYVELLFWAARNSSVEKYHKKKELKLNLKYFSV